MKDKDLLMEGGKKKTPVEQMYPEFYEEDLVDVVPIPFEYLAIMESLTDEEFGHLVRLIMEAHPDGKEVSWQDCLGADRHFVNYVNLTQPAYADILA